MPSMLVVQTPFGGGEITARGGVMPKVQTTSPKNGKNGLFWVRWSAIWANPGTRQTRPPTTATFPRNTADKSPPQQHDLSILRLIGHVVLLGSYLARLGMPFSSARGPAIPSLGNPAHVRDRRPTCGIGGPRAEQAALTLTAQSHRSSHTARSRSPGLSGSQRSTKNLWGSSTKNWRNCARGSQAPRLATRQRDP